MPVILACNLLNRVRLQASFAKSTSGVVSVEEVPSDTTMAEVKAKEKRIDDASAVANNSKKDALCRSETRFVHMPSGNMKIFRAPKIGAGVAESVP